MKNSSSNKKLGALIIDMQPSILQYVEPSENQILIYSHINMINSFAQRKIPTVILEHYGWGETNDILREEITKIPEHEYMTKKKRNGFEGTDLEAQLNDWQIQELIIMGVYASQCVKETAQGALDLDKGYSIYTARQLIANANSISDQKQFRKDVPSWYKKNGVYLSDYKKIFKATANFKNSSSQ